MLRDGFPGDLRADSKKPRRERGSAPGLFETETGDPISPKGGYIGGLEIITAVVIDPAGNAWVANSRNDTDAGFSKDPDEAQ